MNNTASHDVSVIDLSSGLVIQRIPLPDTPIVMAVHPSGHELWVSSEGVHRLTVISIPDEWRDDPRNVPVLSEPGAPVTEVAVMGMIHASHRSSELWGLEQVEQTIRSFAPDVVCAEIAPDRWERIERDLRVRDVIEDPRVQRFPEYTDLILRLSAEAGFEIVPCAGWILEMSDLRNARIAEFVSDERWAGVRDEYERRLMEVGMQLGAPDGAEDDPVYIHSDAYDQRYKATAALYDEYQNDMIGPGGWTNINVEHYRNVDRTIREYRGKRILITFGAGHKYQLLERLRARTDVLLVSPLDVLPLEANR